MIRLLGMTAGCFFTAGVLMVSACTDSHTSGGAAKPTIVARTAERQRSAPTRARRSGITIHYRFMQEPARVGEPLFVYIRFGSTTEKAPMEVYYRIDSDGGMVLGSGQPEQLQLKADEEGAYPEQRVVVLPQQEGRFYLQVSVGLQLSTGLQMRPLSIPIQVGVRDIESVAPVSRLGEQGISLPARMD